MIVAVHFLGVGLEVFLWKWETKVVCQVVWRDLRDWTGNETDSSQALMRSKLDIGIFG